MYYSLHYAYNLSCIAPFPLQALVDYASWRTTVEQPVAACEEVAQE